MGLIMNYDALFSQNYFEARDKFLFECKENDFSIISTLNPNCFGPNNSKIYMDCAYKGPQNPKSLLVIISGTHGPEGYCGSAFQYGLLKSKIANEWAKEIKIAFIHAHNAYGFAWDTRFNEDNIDLNRNYLENFENLPKNEAYNELAQWALPQDFSDENVNFATIKLLEYARENGFEALQAALTSGQYEHPKGVYFGGFEASWSNIVLSKYLDDMVKGINQLVIIDMHTGLGNFGNGEILSDCDPQSNEFLNLFNIWGNEVISTKTGKSVSANLNGSMDGALMKRYKHLKPAIIALEFGTIDPLSVFRATQATSWLHSYGDPLSELGKKLTQLSRDAFYPQSSEWNEKVWLRSLEVASKAFEAIK